MRKRERLKLPPEEMPKIKGSAMGFFNIFCNKPPQTDKIPPHNKACNVSLALKVKIIKSLVLWSSRAFFKLRLTLPYAREKKNKVMINKMYMK